MQFDNLSDTLSDMVGSDPANNTVGNTMSQIYPNLGDTSDAGIKATKQVDSVDNAFNKSPNGRWYGSPAQYAEAVTNFGKFFKGDAQGNEYTNGFKKPAQTQGAQAVNPNDFYARWYEKLRQFAEAKEVTDSDVKVKSR